MILTRVQTSDMAGVMNKFTAYAKWLDEDTRGEASLAGASTAASLVSIEMAQPKSGEWYFRDWMRVPSSAPGEFPAIQMGELVNSFKTEKIGGGRAVWEASGKHAIWMEYGWHDRGGNLHQRPFMRTGIVKYRNKIKTAMKLAMMQRKPK